jgi:oligopeptide/dipeptide ABC transporter ATP-binding protein
MSESTMTDPGPPDLGPADDPALRVSGLTVVSGDRRQRGVAVLKDVSLCVSQGEIVAVVGESGSGKSTLCRAILQLLPPGLTQVEGRIVVGGQDLSGLGARSLSRLRGRQIGAVFQDPLASLDPLRRFRPQLLEARQIHRIDRSRREAHRWASETLVALGFADPDRAAGSYPSQLSGGMRQRLCIGIAFSAGPSLILADEPVTSLDVSLQERVLDVLLQQRATTGAAVLLVAHDMALVRAVADRVVVMYSGAIVEAAPAAELFANPCHPYTKRLIASEFALRDGRQAWAALSDAISEGPNYERDTRTQAGCPYRHMCPRAVPVCSDQFPSVASVAHDHELYCWNSEATNDAQ